MNIKEAKEQVKQTVLSYLERDEFGNKIIPTSKQRPIFLVGAPGLGKTDIMAQVANELNIGLVSYSLTHHTRQSALGLPIISDKTYLGKSYKVSEYSMSEIIASVYDMIELTGNENGILFIDEINCVSETLQPIMLQFLQSKTFGKHKVPENFIVVSAGNPTAFNDSARDFDSVILDRVKKINVVPDFEVWKEYAYSVSAHQAIISFLTSNQQYFYVVEKNIKSDSIVTARGWIDLSNVISVYEKKGFEVTLDLVIQYIQNEKIAIQFFNYYSLYIKYNQKFNIEQIISGKYTDELINNVSKAKFDEKMAVMSLIHSALRDKSRKQYDDKILFDTITPKLRTIISSTTSVKSELENQKLLAEKEYNDKKLAGNISQSDKTLYPKMFMLFDELLLGNTDNGAEAKKTFFSLYTKYSANNKKVSENFNSALKFIEKACSESDMTVFVSEITFDQNTAFILKNVGVSEYSKHASNVLKSSQINEINSMIDSLGNFDDLLNSTN